MAMKDTGNGYGWLSILLHWTTAIVIVFMLYIGNSIAGLAGGERQAALVTHTSIAMTTYLILWLRIVWRFVYHHPGPLPEQGRFFFMLGKSVHMITLIALGCMLISGPLMVWTMGQPIQVFDWFAIPTPFDAAFGVNAALHAVHHWAAIVIFVGILLHIGGVYKHTAFNQDGTLTKIIIPAKPAKDEARPAGWNQRRRPTS
jgi:cytochrome b561